MIPHRKKKVPEKNQAVHQSADWFVPTLIAALEREHGVDRSVPLTLLAGKSELPEEAQAAVNALRLCGKKSCLLGDESYGSRLFEVADSLEKWARALPTQLADAILAELAKKKPAKKRVPKTNTKRGV